MSKQAETRGLPFIFVVTKEPEKLTKLLFLQLSLLDLGQNELTGTLSDAWSSSVVSITQATRHRHCSYITSCAFIDTQAYKVHCAALYCQLYVCCVLAMTSFRASMQIYNVLLNAQCLDC